MLALLLLTAWLRPCAAQGNELVMATTFSPSATVWIIDRWQQEPGSVMIGRSTAPAPRWNSCLIRQMPKMSI